MNDKRRFPRLDSTFQVKYCPEGKDTTCSYTVSDNVSRGGICMPICSAIAHHGAVVKLDLKGNNGKDHVLATGKIRWTRPLMREAPLDEEAGIEFVDIVQSEIDRFIKTSS